MPYLLIFGEDIVALSGAITDKWVIKLFCGRNKKTSNDQVKFAEKDITTNLIACELSIKRVDLFVLFVLILYVPSTTFQLNRDGSSWVEPVLS